MRTHRLKAHGEEVVGRHDACRALPFRVAKRLDGLHTPAGQILCSALNEHPTKATAGEVREHMSGKEENRVCTDWTRRECNRTWYVSRRCIQHVTRGRSVDVHELAARPPLQEHRGDPSLLL